jgi:hypothetical protein
MGMGMGMGATAAGVATDGPMGMGGAAQQAQMAVAHQGVMIDQSKMVAEPTGLTCEGCRHSKVRTTPRRTRITTAPPHTPCPPPQVKCDKTFPCKVGVRAAHR